MRVNQTRTKNGTLISLYETSRSPLFMGVSRYFRCVIPLGFKPKTFRTGICHSISLSIPLFMGIFAIPQKRICADLALLILSCRLQRYE